MLKAQGKSSGRTGTKILLEAMSKDKVHLARFVLDALDGEIVDSRTEGAQTPLISSILLPDSHTRCKFVELLLQRGANVNCQDGDGRTALSYACERGYLEVVKILVQNGADPEIVDVWGNTALMYAAVEGHSPVVEFLVRAFKRLGLQIHRQNKVGNSAVAVAKFLGHTKCICALTSNSKKGREAEGGARGDAQQRLHLGGGDGGDELEREVGHLVNKLESCHHADCQLVQSCTWRLRPRMKPSRLPSMGSIEEFDRENESSSSPPQELVFSGVLTPKPPPRFPNHSPNSTHPKPGERLNLSDDRLPPLIQSCEPQKSILPSPRPSRPSAPSALGILLTPIHARKSENYPEAEKSKIPDIGVRRFHDSYYQKRCSLPTSVLSPAPPERTLAPLRKTKTVKRREASPCKAEPLQVTAPAAAASTTTFSVLSNKLLRRFTSPEFKKDVRELGEDPLSASGQMPRSETFPLGFRHPQVGSKASIDSISSVKCEFDFQLKKTNF